MKGAQSTYALLWLALYFIELRPPAQLCEVKQSSQEPQRYDGTFSPFELNILEHF